MMNPLPDPYVRCPELETENFILRLVRADDAQDLLKCYSDPEAQKHFNPANCTSSFCYQTLDEMRSCIQIWLNAYSQQDYVRFAIVDRSSGRAIGTIEMFGMIGRYKTDRGILRLDISSAYETKDALTEILGACVENFYALFAVSTIATKAIPQAAARIDALLRVGFAPYDVGDRELNYIRPN